jgi:hypothetical protein
MVNWRMRSAHTSVIAGRFPQRMQGARWKIYSSRDAWCQALAKWAFVFDRKG